MKGPTGVDAEEPLPVGSEWRPRRRDRIRALARWGVSSILGDSFEVWLRGMYHRTLRRVGRFGLPENSATEAVLAAIAMRSRTIIDIGANVGRYAWFLRRYAPSRSMLYAIEPHPAAARLVASALGSSRSKVLEVAASDRDGTAELVVPDGPFGSSVSALAWVRTVHHREDRRVLGILTRRIDGLVEVGTMSIDGPVFMKIDVEGAEGQVLRGAAGVIRRHQPLIYFECQTLLLARQDDSPEVVWDELRDAGYRILANRASSFVRVDQIQPDIANYFAIPSMHVPDDDQPLDVDAVIAAVGRWSGQWSV